MKKLFKRLSAAFIAFAMFASGLPVVFAANDTYTGDLRWDFAGGLEGWKANGASEIVKVEDGVITARALAPNKNNHSVMIENQSIDMSSYNYLRVRMKDTTASTEMVAYFKDAKGNYIKDGGSIVKGSITKPAKADSDFVTYSIAVPSAVMESTVSAIRFDYIVNSGGTEALCYIDSIVLSKYDKEQTAKVLSGVKIGGADIEEFDGTKEYCETRLSARAYANLSASTVSADTDTAFSGATTSVSIKTFDDYKYVDITANYDGGSKTYRIACREKEFYAGDIRFDFSADEDGFTGSGAKISVAGGIASLTPHNSTEPSVSVKNLSVKPAEHKYIRIKMKNKSSSETAVIKFSDADGENTLSYNLETEEDEEFQVYTAKLDDFTVEGLKKSEYTNMSFAFMTVDGHGVVAEGSVDVDYIVISQNNAEQTNEILSAVSAGGKKIEDFDPASEYCETEVYEDVLSEITKDSVVLTYEDEYEDSVAHITVKDVGSDADFTNQKVIDIVIGVGETAVYRCYRIVCIPVQKPGTVNKYPGDIRWDFTTDSEGFTTDKAVINGVENGIMKVTADNNADPNLFASGIDIDLSEYKYIRVGMKDGSNSEYMEFYLLESSGYNNRMYYKLKKESAAPDSEFKEYVAPISDFVVQSGTQKDSYQRLRFDFINDAKTGYAEIDYIIISKFKTSPKTNMVTKLSLGGAEVSEFDGSPYCEAKIYDDIYDELSEDSVSCTFAGGYEGADVKVRTKDITGRKVLDITVIKDRFVRDYRIVLESEARPVGIVIDSVSADGYKLSFSGSVSYDSGTPVTKPILLIVHEADKSITYQNMEYMGIVTPDKDGEFDTSIVLYDPETTARDCQMELVFDIMGEDAPVKKAVRYVNNTTISNAVEDLKEETSTGVIEYMAQHRDMFDRLNVWIDLYNSLTASEQELADRYAEQYRNTLTLENSAEVANGALITVLEKSLASDKLVSYVSEFDKKVKEIKVDGTNYSDFDEKVWVLETVKSNRPSGGYTDWAVLYKNIKQAMLLSKVNNTAYTALCDLLLENTEILNNQMTKLKNTNSSNPTAVKTAMRNVVQASASKKFTTVNDLINTVNDKIDAALLGGGGGSGGNSSGSSSSKKNDDILFSGNVDDTADETVTKKPFNDLAGFEWAEDDILSLYERGVVNGTEKGNFEPQRAVTREEFVKLVCEAFGFGKGGKTYDFEDISENSWFNEYVAKAVEIGIVKGISSSRFGSGENITREDMAVIIYRAMTYKGINMNESSKLFTDSASIADYARTAVNMLCGEGIVNGMADGSFAPKSLATRAEAAVMLSRCLERFSI